MKKVIIISALFLLALTAFAMNKFRNGETAVSKEINLSISSHNDYSFAAYRNDKASVHVVVYKVCGSKQTVVMDKQYDAIHLQDIPAGGNAINQKLVIPAVFNSKEQLVVIYTISYESNGSILQYTNGKAASDKDNKEQIEINI